MHRILPGLVSCFLLAALGCTKDEPRKDPIGPVDAFAKVVFTTTPGKDRVKIGETWEYHFDWRTDPPGYEASSVIRYTIKDGFEQVEFDAGKKLIRVTPQPTSPLGEQELAYIIGETAWYSMRQPIILIIDPPSGSAHPRIGESMISGTKNPDFPSGSAATP